MKKILSMIALITGISSSALTLDLVSGLPASANQRMRTRIISNQPSVRIVPNIVPNERPERVTHRIYNNVGFRIYFDATKSNRRLIDIPVNPNGVYKFDQNWHGWMMVEWDENVCQRGIQMNSKRIPNGTYTFRLSRNGCYISLD